MAHRLALDIGATTITARLGGADGRRSTVLFDGSASVPAAVCFDDSGACAGDAAIAAGAGDPSAFAGSALTAVLSGQLRYADVDRNPAELLMPVLSMVLGHAQDIDADPPEQIACIVPVGTAHRLHEPMTAAARSLGLPEPSLIPEPVAAVLHATGGRGLQPGSTGVVINVGGSSMEVTVLRGTVSGAPSIVVDRSDRSLGGDDVDKRIMAWLGHFLEQDNPPLAAALRAETNRTLLASLRGEVRRAKEDLARVPETDIGVTTQLGHGNVRITRGHLDRILADWSHRARGLVATTLADAGLPADGSVGCFVIGGGASLPTLRAALAPVARLTVAHEPLTAAADGALLAGDHVIAAIATMDDTPTGVVEKQGPRNPDQPSTSSLPRMPKLPEKLTEQISPFLARTKPVAPHTPPPTTLPAEFRRIWPGGTHIVAESTDDAVWQWGDLPLMSLVTKPLAPHQVPGVRGPVRAASSGESFSVLIDAHGGTVAWGTNDFEQIGVTDTPTPKNATVHPEVGEPLIDVSCGTSHTLAITADGHVLSWGAALGGRLGNAAPMDITPQLPTPVTDNVCDIVSVAAGRNHSLALDESGRLWGWGRDNRGQLTGKSGKGSPYPMRLPTAVPFTNIAAGKDVTLALDSEGTVWSWGRNDRGQLGLGGPPTRNGAGRVQLPAPAVRIFVTHTHAGAILMDGTLFVWGGNTHGQLGRPGDPRGAAADLRSNLPRGAKFLFGGGDQAAAGPAGDGQGFSSRPLPVQLPGGATAADAGGGDAYTVCLTDDGKIYTWGYGHHGVDGTTRRGTSTHVPTLLAGQPGA